MRFAAFTRDQVADVLADAREYLEQHGWWRGQMRGPNGQQACAVGAILFSQNLGETDMRSEERVMEAIRVLSLVVKRPDPFNDATDTVMNWNDHGAKDKQEVLDAFAKAEKIERAGFDPDES